MILMNTYEYSRVSLPLPLLPLHSPFQDMNINEYILIFMSWSPLPLLPLHSLCHREAKLGRWLRFWCVSKLLPFRHLDSTWQRTYSTSGSGRPSSRASKAPSKCRSQHFRHRNANRSKANRHLIPLVSPVWKHDSIQFISLILFITKYKFIISWMGIDG